MDTKKNSGASCVRFTEQELTVIENASKSTGFSIPQLLKNAFFNGRIVRPIFDKESAHDIRIELNRIGVNINQIAREINSGLKKGWHLEFEECNRLLSKITQSIAVKFANN